MWYCGTRMRPHPLSTVASSLSARLSRLYASSLLLVAGLLALLGGLLLIALHALQRAEREAAASVLHPSSVAQGVTRGRRQKSVELDPRQKHGDFETRQRSVDFDLRQKSASVLGAFHDGKPVAAGVAGGTNDMPERGLGRAAGAPDRWDAPTLNALQVRLLEGLYRKFGVRASLLRWSGRMRSRGLSCGENPPFQPSVLCRDGATRGVLSCKKPLIC